MTSFILTFTGSDASAQRALGRLERALLPESLGVYLAEVVDPYLSARASKRFADEGDAAVGGPWKPLAEFTKADRVRKQFGEGPINHRTGQLEDWIVDSATYVVPNPTGATLIKPGDKPAGELKKKVRTAQIGDQKTGTPPRPVIALDALDLAAVTTSLEAYIRGAMGL